jgi:hypothetical protein
MMNTKAKQIIQRLDRQRLRRQALIRLIVACLWLDKRNAPSYGGDAA